MSDNNEPVYSVLNGKGNGTWGQGGPPAGTTAWSCLLPIMTYNYN